MYNGMMDPELFRIAQEQISRMSPAELARIQQQMMANPELMRMASESMKNMRPEDLKYAAEQLKHTPAGDMAEIGEKMASSSPEEIAAMRARLDAQISYEINAAQMLKKQGNELHCQGKFQDALQKYLLAKKNLNGIPASKGRTLLLACSLNLMSCYLKTRQFDECIREGSEVLSYDAKNVKALYRRGQAYKELGRLREAVFDLSKAHEVSPNDETIVEVLRDLKGRVAKEDGERPSGLIIEEITEGDEAVSYSNHASKSVQVPSTVPEETPEIQTDPKNGGLSGNAEPLKVLKDDPHAIRSFQNFISNTDPEKLATMGAGSGVDVPPDMMKAATNMISSMSPEELQNMIQMASSFQGGNPYSKLDSLGPGTVPTDVTPEMLRSAADMMSRIPPDEFQKMFEMASSFKGEASTSTAELSNTNGPSTSARSKLSKGRESSAGGRKDILAETSSHRSFPDLSSSRSTFPSSSTDLQEQMRKQMNDPAMRQMFTSMIKNMSPDMMANMGEQFGFKLSSEDAAKAQQALSSLSTEDLDRMMRWADRVQKGAEVAKKTKNWLLGRSGLILAICMLILAMILHRLGYIGG